MRIEPPGPAILIPNIHTQAKNSTPEPGGSKARRGAALKQFQFDRAKCAKHGA